MGDKRLTKREALDKLQALVHRSRGLPSHPSFRDVFEKWQHDCRVVLKHVFANDPEYLKEFRDILFTSLVATSETPEGEKAFELGLSSARAFLESRIEEVREFWTDVDSSPDVPAVVAPKTPELVFVIHGRRFLSDFHAFLRAMGLKPFEWSQARKRTGTPNPYTWEIVDTALRIAGAIVALLTPDDEARLHPDVWSDHENALEKEYFRQPRQNVLFEAGVAYGRAPDRTVLIRIGAHRHMSDLAGHDILQLDDSPQSRQAVADALHAAGCPVDLSGSDWYRAGNFADANT